MVLGAADDLDFVAQVWCYTGMVNTYKGTDVRGAPSASCVIYK